MASPRRFPLPWQVEQTSGGFKVQRRGFSFCLPAVNGSGSSRFFHEQKRRSRAAADGTLAVIGELLGDGR
jgi:hypothetical protein